MADNLGRTEQSVRSFFNRRHIPTRKDNYSDTELLFLRENAGSKPWHEIASELGRSTQGIMVKASKQRLAGSFSHKKRVPESSPWVECGGLFCAEPFQKVRKAQRFCSVSCQQSIYQLVKYSLTKETWWELFRAQGNACICGRVDVSRSWHVDHDHSCCPTGSSCGKCVRGLLCPSCNQVLGSVHDNPTTLRNLAQYLDNISR